MDNDFKDNQLVCAKKYPRRGGFSPVFGFVRRVGDFGMSVVWLDAGVLDYGLYGAESEFIGREEYDKLEIEPVIGDGEIFLSEVAP